jgi:hypothetical protein
MWSSLTRLDEPSDEISAMRRRWVVLLVGTARLAVGHRTELSRHRTLEGARAAALDAESRLREGPIATARDYVVAIERDGERVPVHDDTSPAPTVDVAGRATPSAPDDPPGAARDAVASDQDPAEPPPTDADDTTDVDAVEAPAVDGNDAPAEVEDPPAVEVDETPAADVEETPATEDGDHTRIIVPGRYVPDDVERGLRDQDGRELPGPGPVPEEMIRDWEAKIARLEGDPTAGDETTTSRSRRRGADGGSGSAER